jgi:riboflavin kinase/FMN adenylyltransferase
MIDGVWRGSVTNIGRPPTLQADGPTYLSEKVVVETHVLDFDGDLYGKDLEIQFVDRIRSEQVFHSPDALAQRIAADIQEARRRLPEAPDRLDAPP